MKKRIVALGLAATMTAALLAGCGNSSKETKAETKAETTAESTAEAAEGDYKYAVILKTQATDFWTKMWKGVEDKAAEMGVQVDIYSAQSEEDFEGQVAILEKCINDGYDGIAIAPLSASNMVSTVAKATTAGITIDVYKRQP